MRLSPKSLAIISCSVTAAFLIGVKTAGDIDPIVDATVAGGTVITGDFTGDGKLTAKDIETALELARGLRAPTALELAADPDQDFRITMEDVVTILETMEYDQR